MTKYHSLGVLSNTYLFLIVLEAGIRDQGAGRVGVQRDISSWLVDGGLFISSHGPFSVQVETESYLWGFFRFF